MEGATLLERLVASRAPITWRTATIREIRTETPHAKTLALDVPEWESHEAGQHVDVRLTAEDGYQAQRSYSIASAPEDQRLALTVERVEDGEVSPYLVEELRAGDAFELRGPIGGHFTWSVADGGPVLLVAGGSGLVPLMAMLRHRAAAGSAVPARLLVSARTIDDLLYADELEQLDRGDPELDVQISLTRAQPPGWSGLARRVDEAMLRDVAFEPRELARTFVCGPTAFVEEVADLLVSLGHEPALVKTERFGPSGGGT